MTFTEMKTQVQGWLGISGGSDTVIGSMINDAVQEFASRRKWPFYETEASLAFVIAQRDYTLASTVVEVLEVLDASGIPLSEIDRSTYSEMYRGDTTTGAAPKVWAPIGSPAANTPAIGVWPVPSAGSTGKTRHMRRPPLLSAGADVVDVPNDCLWIVMRLALSTFKDWEDSEMGAKVRTEAERGLSELAVRYGLERPSAQPAGVGQ